MTSKWRPCDEVRQVTRRRPKKSYSTMDSFCQPRFRCNPHIQLVGEPFVFSFSPHIRGSVFLFCAPRAQSIRSYTACSSSAGAGASSVRRRSDLRAALVGAGGRATRIGIVPFVWGRSHSYRGRPFFSGFANNWQRCRRHVVLHARFPRRCRCRCRRSPHGLFWRRV